MNKFKWKIAQYLENIWWKQYLLRKNTTQYLGWKKNYWQQFIAQYLSDIFSLSNQNIQILDAGCGPAGIFTVLHAHQVDAIDPLLNQYEKLPQFSKSAYSYVQFKQQSIELLNAKNQYEIVFCLNAINHVENIDNAVKALCQSAMPNGFICISTDAHKYNFLKVFFTLIPLDVLHPQQYTVAEYQKKFLQENIELISVKTINKGLIFDYVLFILKKKL